MSVRISYAHSKGVHTGYLTVVSEKATHGGDRKSEAVKSNYQNDSLINGDIDTKETADRVAEKEGVSRMTIHRDYKLRTTGYYETPSVYSYLQVDTHVQGFSFLFIHLLLPARRGESY